MEGSQSAEEAVATDAATVLDTVPVVETSPASALAATDTPVAEPAEPTPGQEQDVIGMIGAGLFVIVLVLFGLAALMLVRSNRRKAKAAAVVTRPAIEPKPVTPVETETVPATIATTPALGRTTAPARAVPNGRAAVALPREMPSSFEERDALLKRMIDARPDRANPFTNRLARVRRARLILQSLPRKFESSEPWIDLSDYTSNWPALSRRYARAA